ncbi:hypothetical protein NDGK_01753 [Clostridiales bacterium CHKCI001]|nr:hypothetical protein NDGK_01753 [Clostridiales bacterium CHKCI001]
MDEMMKRINKFGNGTYLKVEWENGRFVLGGRIDTIYETNNGLEEDEVGYREFYACAFKIEKIFQNFTNEILKENGLIEISIENQPTLITLSNGKIIWKSGI